VHIKHQNALLLLVCCLRSQRRHPWGTVDIPGPFTNATERPSSHEKVAFWLVAGELNPEGLSCVYSSHLKAEYDLLQANPLKHS